MKENYYHDLAVAYAQAKLIKRQQENPNEDLLDSELRFYIKAFNYAMYQLPIEDKDLDERF